MEKKSEKEFPSLLSFLGRLPGKIWKKHQKERRKFPRKHKVYIAEAEISGEKRFITVTNLSREGMGVCLDKKLSEGTEVKLTFSHEFASGELKGKKIDIVLWAKVQWSKEAASDQKEFDTGLALDYVPETISPYYEALLRELQT